MRNSITALVVGLVAFVGRDTNATEVHFATDIQPILAKRCYACHGPADQESGLALDDFKTATRELESGERAIVPGNPNSSEMIKRITSGDEALRMPPEGDALSANEIEKLTTWIESGAEYSPHWAFVKPIQHSPPKIRQPDLAANAIDRFIWAKLEAIDLPPAERATPEKLIRRLYLDLLGLLPSVQEVDAFVVGETSYSELVDQLLDSDAFGERWGRHWLDLARYADSFGYERDDVRPNAWRYRDWVIRSINRNQPYDQFLIEQLAGDLLEDASEEQRIATGLHRMNIKNNESGINKEDYRNREMVDRVNTTSTAMLGLTLGCCQCHSHKYDPFSQTEYYQVYAFFNNVETKNVDIEGTPEEQSAYQQAKQALDAHRSTLDARGKLLSELRKHKSFLEWRGEDESKTHRLCETLGLDDPTKQALLSPADHASELSRLWKSLPGRADDVNKAKRQLSVETRHLPKPYIMVLAEKNEKRRKTHVLNRGDFKQKGNEVSANTPSVLPAIRARGDQPDRLDLARWIASDENPLSARVAVNHIWKHLFGRGIVTTMDDFGTQGEPPTHPKLLDWLAVEFMSSGWDRKKLIRTIVHSSTYRQSSQVTASPDDFRHRNALGPDNPLFARQARFRVESEIVRDIFLTASGLIHHEVGGPTIRPIVPSAVTDLAYKYKTRWVVSGKPQRYRRGIYIHFKRTNPYPTLLMFDGPESNVCQASRNRSNTPLQALATLNDPVFVECAQSLGHQLATQSTKIDDRLDWLAKRSLARPFSKAEKSALKTLLGKEQEWYDEHPEAATKFAGSYLVDEAPAEAAAWTAVARTVLNLDEFVTRE